MPVDSPNTIDLVSHDEETGLVSFVITDHLGWDLREHPEVLVQKVQAYLNFLLSEQVAEKFPQFVGKQMAIEVTCLHAPPPEALDLLTALEKKIAEFGIGFSWQHSGFRYFD